MDLTMKYLGFSLRSPRVPSASPLSAKINNVRTMEQASAAAVVFDSWFEEQIEASAPEFRVDPKSYLENIARQARRQHSNNRQFELPHARTRELSRRTQRGPESLERRNGETRLQKA